MKRDATRPRSIRRARFGMMPGNGHTRSRSARINRDKRPAVVRVMHVGADEPANAPKEVEACLNARGPHRLEDALARCTPPVLRPDLSIGSMGRR